MSHTPGPWKRLQGMIVGNLHRGERGTEGDVVCLMKGYIDYKNQDANARLIAAAPELFEACRDALHQISTDSDLETVTGADKYKTIEAGLRAAIAKAEGADHASV